VVYGGEYGPDLEKVAEYQGISTEEVIRVHTEKTYTVRCLGAPAGSPMMDGPAFPKPVPRLKDPRLSVPAGAVAVAGRQAVIAPAVAPGGWCVIGQTPLTVLNIRREPLVPYKPGDILRFRCIEAGDFDSYLGRELEPRP
jgi:KipI family sensor histidine kinase inhibitor